jgi:hypothetical protein
MTAAGHHIKFFALLAVSWFRLLEPEYHPGEAAFIPGLYL